MPESDFQSCDWTFLFYFCFCFFLEVMTHHIALRTCVGWCALGTQSLSFGKASLPTREAAASHLFPQCSGSPFFSPQSQRTLRDIGTFRDRLVPAWTCLPSRLGSLFSAHRSGASAQWPVHGLQQRSWTFFWSMNHAFCHNCLYKCCVIFTKESYAS